MNYVRFGVRCCWSGTAHSVFPSTSDQAGLSYTLLAHINVTLRAPVSRFRTCHLPSFTAFHVRRRLSTDRVLFQFLAAVGCVIKPYCIEHFQRIEVTSHAPFPLFGP